MKLSRVFSVLVAMLLISSLGAFAGEDKQDAKQEAPVEFKNQTICPVMGGKIDSTVFTDIQGQRVYHCCPMCSKSLKKDPDKFFKEAAADGILFENIQTSCPVSGEKLEDKSVFVDYEGRRIAFCCKKCRGAFNADPAKFMSNLDSPAKVEKTEMKKMKQTGHEGHNH